MRTVAHGTVWFPDPADSNRVQALMVDYCSARRAAYQALQRGLKINDARKAVKVHYSHLGQRFINDAVSEAARVTQPNALFGGKRAWKDMQSGLLSKGDWKARRNNTLYSRGDKTKQGNPNLRIVRDELWVNDPNKRGLWLKGHLWLNKPVELTCYEVRVQFKDGKFKVTVSWGVDDVPVGTSKQLGAIGLDVNPDGVALVETNADGCLLHQEYVGSGRAMFAKKNKRAYDVRQMAVEIVDKAEQAGKPIVLEKLTFKNAPSKNPRFNRMRSNFLHRQMIEAINSRAARSGVEVIEVNPAFTSVIGNLKYADPLSLNRHTAAALVIARVGLGLKEVVRVDRVEQETSGKKRVTLEGRTRRIALTEKALSWMEHLYDVRPKLPGVTPPHLDAGDSPGHMVQASSQGEEVIEPYNWSGSSSPSTPLGKEGDVKW